MRLATLGVVAEKLRARSPEVRTIALIHAKGHGEKARPLAAYVATLLSDVEQVAWHATGTFGAIAAGAGDATSVLVDYLQREGAPPVLVTRALFGLQRIGPEAWAALPVLESMLEGPHRKDVIAAMAAIAPDNPKIAALIIESMFSDDYGVASTASDALRNGSAPLLEAANHALRLRAFSFSKTKREQAHRVLATMARMRPQATQQLMFELARGSKPRWWLLVATAALPRPVAPALVQLAIDCLSSDDTGLEERALETLKAIGVAAEPRALVEKYATAVAVPGGEGSEARVFAEAALMLAKGGVLVGAGLQLVHAWLERAARADPAKQKKVNWYTVRTVVRAAGLASQEGWAHVVAIAKASQRYLGSDESGVLDLHRTLRELALTEGQQRELAKTGVPRDDPYASADDEDDEADAGAEPDYPEFPADEAPAVPGALEPAAEPDQTAELARGLAALGHGPAATPHELIESLQSFLQRQQREQLAPPDDAVTAGLAAVWAHALSAAFGWKWAHYVRGEERALVLADAGHGVMVFPLAWLRRQLRKRDPTALLQFNMVAAAKFPPKGDEPTALW